MAVWKIYDDLDDRNETNDRNDLDDTHDLHRSISRGRNIYGKNISKTNIGFSSKDKDTFIGDRAVDQKAPDHHPAAFAADADQVM